MDYELLTIPRTGSNYLLSLMKQKILGLPNIDATHHFTKNNKYIITLARDPKDTTISRSAMSGIITKPINKGLCLHHLNAYVELSEKLYEQAKIVIAYDDLINYPDKVIKYLAKEMNLTYKDVKYKPVLKDNLIANYIVTSKTLSHYDDLKPVMNTLDFTAAYDIYNKMLSKAISLDDF